MTDSVHVSAQFLSRRGWLSGPIPLSLKGIGGPGAPHEMRFVRRCDIGLVSVRSVPAIYWKRCRIHWAGADQEWFLDMWRTPARCDPHARALWLVVRVQHPLFLPFSQSMPMSFAFGRTKQWMHQANYGDAFLFLPRRWALCHLPAGIPRGRLNYHNFFPV